VVLVLDSLLRRGDVISFIEKIKDNPRYYDKKREFFENYSFFVSSEVALYIFYEALLKYQIIIDDVYLFDTYLEQLEKLYRKLDNIEDIRVGIHKLICSVVMEKLGIKDSSSVSAKKEVITYIYNKYITEGYLFHGFHCSYLDTIKDNGFVSEKYENYYENFRKLNDIFAKYNAVNIISKDFSEKEVFLTDDIMHACYYSKYSPMFYYNFLMNEEYFGKRHRKDAFLKDDYLLCTKNLKRFMSDYSFSEEDKKFVNDLIKKEWDLLHRCDRSITLLLVKRNQIFEREKIKLVDYLEDEDDIFQIVDRLLSSKCNHVKSEVSLESSQVEIICLDDYPLKKEEVVELHDEEDEYYKYKEEEVTTNFLTVYGQASVFMILGSLLISLGVIFTILMILGGA